MWVRAMAEISRDPWPSLLENGKLMAANDDYMFTEIHLSVDDRGSDLCCVGAHRTNRAHSHSSGRGRKLSSCRAFSFEAPRRRVA